MNWCYAQVNPTLFKAAQSKVIQGEAEVVSVDIIDSLIEPIITKASVGIGHGSESPEIEKIKEELNRKKHRAQILYKNNPDSVRIEASFDANPTQNFTPMDNTMAIGKSRHIVSAINANFAIYDLNGTRLQYSTFKQLTGNASFNGRFFDPRITYDHESDRYVMMILYGNNSTDSRLLVFASKTNNPLQGWHKLELDGSPGNSSNWSDFPNIAISKTSVIITCNLFNLNGSYKETGLWSIDKNAFYAGQQASFSFFTNIKSENSRKPFTLVPAQEGLNTPQGDGIYLVSSYANRSNKIDVYFLNLATNSLSTFTAASNDYDIAPDAQQKGSEVLLDIGDCRITSAFYQDELVHFVMNVKGANDNVTVLYGRLDIGNGKIAERRINYHPEVAYAAIAPLGRNIENKAVVISYMYSGPQDFPSLAYVFVDDAMKLYPPSIIAQGKSAVALLNLPEDRWGDYSGAFADPYSQFPSVWISGAASAQNGTWSNYLANIKSDEDTIRFKTNFTRAQAFPNPFTQRLSLRLELPKNTDIMIRLRDEKGALIHTLFQGVVSKGYQVLHFDALSLSQGLYIVEVFSNEERIYSEKLIVKE